MIGTEFEPNAPFGELRYMKEFEICVGRTWRVVELVCRRGAVERHGLVAKRRGRLRRAKECSGVI